ncbi:MAG: 2Fe-2S iron-sulfur cluster binding domain-containing protein [Pedosphaera sp.]|nr:2Fe-2S iron-sulfur cluster binding domain-containing protein [Pedosphaera sp.]
MSAPATTEAKPASPAAALVPPPPSDKIKIKVDGREVEVPKMMPDWQGKPQPTTMLQACHLAGHEVPHYCYHPKLPIAGNCRMCLVEFGTPQLGPDRKPVLNEDGTSKIAKSVLPYEPTTPRGAIACATPISPGMEIYPNSPATKQMREAVLESLLINHPLDCPICDQAGECKLQEYSVQHGQAESRFVEQKVHKPKAVDLGPRIVLDDERCVLCTRCIRFTKDIVGDDALGIVNRGSYNTIAAWAEGAFDNNYTLNTVDICPVGALTSKDFRFQMRVWFMKETKSLCTSCGTGCNIVVGSREEKVYRYEPRQNDAVNSTWMCDSGRLNYKWIGRADRLQKCGMRIAERGMLEVAWPTALKAISAKLSSAPTGSVAVIASARQTTEELWLLAKLAKKFNALTDSIARNGEGDKLLVNSDKNPNSNGSRVTGIAGPQLGANLAKIADGIRIGSIKTLIVFGEDVTKHGIGVDLLAKLDTLIVSDILPNATTAAAHFVLPGCAHVEKRGTFVNVKGRVQKFMRAVEAPGDARPEWEFLHELVHHVTGQNGFSTIEGLFNQMAREVPGFAGLEWAKLGDTGVTVQI